MPEKQPDIFDLGFDKSLNRTLPVLSSGVVYNSVDELTNAQQLQFGALIVGSDTKGFYVDPKSGVWLGNREFGDAPARIGTDGLASFKGVSTLNAKMYTDFEGTTRFTPASVSLGSGSTTFGATGMVLSSGATGTSYIYQRWFTSRGIFKGSPTFSCMALADNISDDGTNSDDRRRQTDIYNIHAALDNYFTTNSNYPTSLHALVPTFLAVLPVDPVTGDDYTYAYKDDLTDAHVAAIFDGSSATPLTADADFNSDIVGWTNGFNGSDLSNYYDFRLSTAPDPALPSTPTGGGSAFFGLGIMGVTGTGHTPDIVNRSYAGFYLLKTSGVTSVFARQCDGNGTTGSTALTTVYDNDILDLILKMNGDSSIDYYVRRNFGALSARTTLTDFVPNTLTSADGGDNCQFSVSNDQTASAFNWILVAASFER